MATRRRVLLSVDGVSVSEVREYSGPRGLPATHYAGRSPQRVAVYSFEAFSEAETWFKGELLNVRADRQQPG